MQNVQFEFRKFYVICCEDIMVATVSMKSKKIISSTHTFLCLSLRQEAVNFLVVSKTKHSKTKTEARSTQSSKTKHPNLENEAP